MNWTEFVKPKGQQKFLGGGKIETLIALPQKKLGKEHKSYGNHTEIQTLAWKEIEPNWM